MMKVNIIGLGYIGLPTALMMATNGIDVIGTDISESLIRSLNEGKDVFDEIGMERLVNESKLAGIQFTVDYQEADIYIIAVPTPYIKSNKKVDVSYLITAFKNILEICQTDSIIVIESTVSPGTIDSYLRPMIEEVDKNIELAHAPERILPGRMLYELQNNPRIIGADSMEVGEVVKNLYKSFCKAEITLTNIKSAEMSKVVENTYRDINIAFANELAKISHIANVDVYEIIQLANKHPRVNILQPGPGVGGHCISVDPWFLVGDYPGLANIILAARKINDSMPEYVLKRVSEIMMEQKININEIGIYGLSYKENVDDVRESPTLQMLDNLEKHLVWGIRVYDPYIKKDIVSNQKHSLQEFLKDIKLVIIMVAHNEIIENLSLLNEKLVFDTRNIAKGNNVYHL